MPSRPQAVHGKPKERQAWAVQQVKYAAKASRNLGLDAHVSFPGALCWPFMYGWPPRPAGLIEEGFDELARRWKPLLDVFDENGVDVGFELHPGEDVMDGATFEMFLERLNNHPRCMINYDPSHFVLQQLDYLDFIDIYHERICAFHVKDAEFNPDRQAGRLFRLPALDQPRRPLPLAGRRTGGFRGDLLEARGVQLRLLGRARMGMLPQGFGAGGHAKARPSSRATSSRSTEKSFDDFVGGLSRQGQDPPHPRHQVRTERHGFRNAAKRTRAASGSAWWAADRAPSSAPCTGSPRAWTISTSSWRARCRPSAKKAKASGEELGLAADRIYTDFKEMAKAEAKRKDGIEAVSIVTPNHVHVPAAMAFIEAGIHVICDKPLALHLKEAKALEKLLARKKDVIFALTHNYSGYPMIRQAKAMVAAGELGEIRVVQGEYPQDWLTTALEKTGQKQAAWRTDPKRSGAGGCVGDIGTHTYQLMCDVSGLKARGTLGRSHLLREGPRAGRQRQCHAALQGRRQGHALGQPGGAGQRERPEDPRLWHQGRTRMEAGRSRTISGTRPSASRSG